MDAKNDTPHVGELYDWWSRHSRALDVLCDVAFLGRERAFRTRAIEELHLTSGERVLEVGCGNGNSFAAIREDILPDGSLGGIDVSRGMTRAARNRISDRGWRNVHVLRGDICRPPLDDGSFDVALAAMSISAVPDPERAIESIETALRPGGRLIVLDARPFQTWPWRVPNRFIVPVAEYATSWVPAVDLVDALRREFEAVEYLSSTPNR